MPAVELSKLRDQINDLTRSFARPDEFMTALRAFMDRHSDNAYRPGNTVSNQPLLASYHLPILVARQLELALTGLAQSQPEQTFAAIDPMWRESRREPRLLAAIMLGQIPLRQAEGVLERLNGWASPSEEPTALETLLNRGTLRLRHEGSDALLELYETWLTQPDPVRRALGLKALLPLVNDPAFENLPPIYALLYAPLRAAPTALFTDLAALLIALAQRSPTETVYFLRQVLSTPNAANTARLARRILPQLPPELQASLKATLRTHRS